MTDDELNAIEARAKAATSGPWREESSPIDGGIILADGIAFVADDVKRIADAIFISHARHDVPALCEEVRRLRADNQRLRLG